MENKDRCNIGEKKKLLQAGELLEKSGGYIGK
jgi:hypothetical protein